MKYSHGKGGGRGGAKKDLLHSDWIVLFIVPGNSPLLLFTPK